MKKDIPLKVGSEISVTMSQSQQVLYILLCVPFAIQIVRSPKGMRSKGLFSGTSHLNECIRFCMVKQMSVLINMKIT